MPDSGLQINRRRATKGNSRVGQRRAAGPPFVEARDQKMVRFLGLTGHHRPDSLMEAIRRFPFDGILLALNAADVHHWSVRKELLPFVVERQMAIIGMKITGRGRLLSTWTPPPLEENVKLARDFTPLSEGQLAALEAKAEPCSKQALFFRFFDRA